MNIYDTPYFNQGNNNEEIIEQDTWRTNMNPQLNRGNYGVSNLNQAPFTGIQQIAHPNMADVSGPVRQDNTSGFDLSNMDNPDADIGPIINFKDAPVEWNETLKGLRMNNPRVGPIDMWKNQGGDETTGFNFPGITGLKNMFQRPEAKQKEFEAYEASMNPQGWGDFGDYKGNIWEGSGGNKINVVDPVTGATVLQNKNFDSAFGSQSVQEMIDKKDAWIADRLLSGKKISKALTSYAMNKGLGTFGGDKPGIGPGKPRGDPTYGGPKTYDFNPSITSKPTMIGQGPLHGATAPRGYQQKSGSHHYMRGGRVGYNTGGRVGILAAF